MEIKRNLASISKPLFLPYLELAFGLALKPYEVAAFRGAVIKKLGWEHDRFHNHKSEEAVEAGPYVHRYPLVQYKSVSNHAMILLLGEASRDAYYVLNQSWEGLRIREEWREIRGLESRAKRQTLQVWDQVFKYDLHNWLPFNKENHERYQACTGLAARIELLEQLLAAHILAFAAGVAWDLASYLKVEIEVIYKEQRIGFKGVNMRAFSLRFASNCSLPDFLGLGRNAAHGYGWIKAHQGFSKKTV